MVQYLKKKKKKNVLIEAFYINNNNNTNRKIVYICLYITLNLSIESLTSLSYKWAKFTDNILLKIIKTSFGGNKSVLSTYNTQYWETDNVL